MALYDLHAAIEIDPAFAALDLAAAYGEPGGRLAAALAADDEENRRGLDGGRGRMVPPQQLEDLGRSRTRSRPSAPGCRSGSRSRWWSALAGRPREPRLTGQAAPR